jgi:PAS domain S-box-containing protein
MPHRLFPRASREAHSADKSPTAKLIEALDWSSTSVGPISSWPQALIVTTRLMLATHVPMVMVMGEKGVLIYNDAYADFAGKRHPEVLGMEVAEAWPEIADFNLAILAKVLSGETVSLKNQLLPLNRHGTIEDAWLNLDYSPVLDDDGRPIAELVIVNEITEQVRAERALARSEENLSLALSVSDLVGIWDWDVTHDVVTADAQFARMYGVDPARAAAGTSIREFVAGVHPEDRDTLEEAIQTAVRDTGELRTEYRLIAPDGTVRWALALGRASASADGSLVRLPGIAIDITERKEAEARLTESEAGFRALADSMPQMVWSTRPDGFHDYYNARWYEFTGTAPGSTDGEGWNDVFHPDDQERAWERWRHSLETGEPYQIEYRLRHHTGVYRWTLGRALPVRDALGRITRWFGTCTDIHDSKRAAEEREVVAQELSHRIKNIFSVMTGIIGLSARSHPEMKPFADQLRQRISAMGKAHDFVRPHSTASHPGKDQSSLRALVTELVQPFQSTDGQRIVFEGDDARIDDASATPVALLVHELATNAAKYGALLSDDGQVLITGAAKDGFYTMTWAESGGPEVASEPKSAGFGSRLIALSVEGQLGGRLERRWLREGLEVTLSVPLDALNRSNRLARTPG